MGLNCKKDVRSYVHRKIKETVGNVSKPDIDSGFANVQKDFGKENLAIIKELNTAFGEKVIEYTRATDSDLTGSIQVTLSERLYDIYLKRYGDSKTVFPKQISIEDMINEQQKNKAIPFNQKFIFGANNKKILVTQDFDLGLDKKSENLNEIKDKLFNGNLTTTSANQFLRQAYHTLDLNDTTKAIVKSMLSTRAKIKFVDKSVIKGTNTYAQYDSDTREIQLNKDILSTGNLHYAFESILHEIVHDTTVQSLLNPKNDNQRAFRNKMVQEYEYFKSKGDNGFYGFTNEAEFVAEIMANEEFRDHLRTINDDNNQSFINRLITYLKSLFGVQSQPRVDSIIDSILDISKNEQAGYSSILHNNYIFKKEASSETSKKNEYSAEFKKELLSSKGFINKILASIEAVKTRSRAKRGVNNEFDDKFTEFQSLMKELAEKSTNKMLFEFSNFANSEIKTILNSLDKSSKAGKITPEFLTRAEAYIAVYSSLQDVIQIADRQHSSGEITDEEYEKVNESLSKAKYSYDIFYTKYINLGKDIMAKKIAPYNNKPVNERKEELEREYIKLNLKGSNVNKAQWIEDKLDEEFESLQQKALEMVRRQLDTIPSDIKMIDSMLSSEKNMDNLILNIASSILDKADFDIRAFTIDARNEFVNANVEYGTSGLTNEKRFGKLIDNDTEGNHYLISKYSSKFAEEYKKEQTKVYEIVNEHGSKSKDAKKAYSAFKKWKRSNIDSKLKGGFDGDVSVLPKVKWLNPKYKSLNAKDKTLLEFLTKKAKEADEDTHGYSSLINKYTDAEFIRLPSVRQTDLNRLLKGDGIGLIKDSLGDLTKIRADDTTRGELSELENAVDHNVIKKMVTINNEERHLVPIHFRNKIDPKDQSLDLITMFLMNSSMAKNFNLKNELQADLKLILDIVDSANVIQVDGAGKTLISAFTGKNEDNQIVTDKGANSKLRKKLKSVFENRLYGITDATTAKILGKDVSSLTNGLNKITADIALSVNHLSSAANLFQGKLQNFIESVGGNTFTKKDAAWAEAQYWKEIKNGALNDIGSHTSNNKLSMMIDKFDLMGDFNAVKNKFEDNSKFRAMMKASTLHGMNSVAEHYIQSTLSLAIMKSVKMKNKKNEYIDINGKVTTKEKAVNFYDAYQIKDGKLELMKAANHTSFSRSKLSDLGELEHQSLIRKKIIDLHGQYDGKWQAEIQRHWYGKLIFMFRKWLVPGYHRRWKGVAHSYVSSDKLTDNQKNYDSSLQEFQEGTYTSLIRFLITGIMPALKEFKIEIATANWNQLLDREKAGIHKTIRELGTMMLMATAASIAAMAAKDDEDNEDALYYMAYLFKRQETELAQFWNVNDQMRIFKTPFASLSTAEKLTGWFEQMMPWNIGDTYNQGANKGQYKAWMKTLKLVPVANQTTRSAKNSYTFLEGMTSN